MQVVTDIFGIISFLLLVAAIAGLLNPKWVKQESRAKAFGIYFGCSLLASLVGGIAAPDKEVGLQDESSVTEAPKPKPYSPTTSPTTATPTVKGKKFFDGIWIVGRDIEPGLYQTQTAGCYWARLSGLSGSRDDVVENGTTPGPSYVSISRTDYAFESRDCKEWLLIDQ